MAGTRALRATPATAGGGPSPTGVRAHRSWHPIAAGTRALRATPATAGGGPSPTGVRAHRSWHPIAAGTRALRATPATAGGGPGPTGVRARRAMRPRSVHAGRPVVPVSPDGALGAATRLAAVIGSPIRHSLSPAMHNAAFRELALDWAYLAFEVSPGEVAAALGGARALGLGGLSVTIPHKAAAASEVDDLSGAALAVGAVNTVVPLADGRLWGDNTDGAGFLASLADEGFDPAGRPCVVLGAGGAARAVVHALATAGAGEVAVVNRSSGRAETAAALAGAVGRVGAASDVAGADLVVNATPLGLAGSDSRSLPFDPDLLGPHQLLMDLVPNPAVTPLMAAARARGARAAGGLGMLVHQGALAFELWTGLAAPVGVMRVAAIGVLT